MGKSTSVALGEHFEGFINEQMKTGRYRSASEVIRASLRLLEEHERRVAIVRQALVDGEQSGDAGVLDLNTIRAKAKLKAGLASQDA